MPLALVVVLAVQAEAQRAPGWELRVPERIELAAGASGTLPITLTIDRGQTISKDAGMTIDLAPDGSIAIKRRRLSRADAVDPEAEAPRFAVPLRAETAGDFAVKLRVRFWLCGTKVCRPIDAKRTIAIAVGAPAAVPRDAGVDAGARR